MTCKGFLPNTAYSLEVDGRYKTTLTFCQSSNIATMYVDTFSGHMKRIHENKNYEENASVTLYTADGTIDYYDELISIGGRGNSSWSPDCNYVDVYFNGEYAGLYLLCQKIDTGSNHLNLQDDDYFFELTLSNRTTNLSTAFDICELRSIDVIAPDNCNGLQMGALQDYINLFQEALFSETGISETNGLSWSDYIDIDSWARKYLIEEVFSNFDSGQASQFFWSDNAEFCIITLEKLKRITSMSPKALYTPNCLNLIFWERVALGILPRPIPHWT